LTPVLDAQRDGAPAGRGRAGGAPAGQRGAQAGRGDVRSDTYTGPRLANGKPDLSGHWANPYTPNMAAGKTVLDPKTKQPLTFARQGEKLADAIDPARTFDLPYTDWGLKHWKAYDPVGKGDYAGNCLPFGMSRNVNSPHGVQILQTPDAVAFLWEQNTWHTWVPTSPSFKWPKDIPETWTGTSVGHWDGDTLIVETNNFNGYTKLDTNGHPHSKQLKMTQTFLRTDQGIRHSVTVEDPKAYTQPWMNERLWRLKGTADVLMEYSCEENNIQNIIDGAIKLWTPPDDIE